MGGTSPARDTAPSYHHHAGRRPPPRHTRSDITVNADGTLATCQRLPDCPAEAVLHRERVREPPQLPGRADQGAPGGPRAHQHRGTEVISGRQSGGSLIFATNVIKCIQSIHLVENKVSISESFSS